ncbi:CHAT domain-containing protein [Lyngbya sp. CCY1209]|nr:CHAT domain-containing protein [Lyngbya sp. CCY1209]MEB3882967.1 CHAT domain-containing protein [Lyngbya sp. CCY1209]
MVKFYQKMLDGGQSPAAALRSAPIDLWQSSEWNSPFFWAGFTLQGEWEE